MFTVYLSVEIYLLNIYSERQNCSAVHISMDTLCKVGHQIFQGGRKFQKTVGSKKGMQLKP